MSELLPCPFCGGRSYCDEDETIPRGYGSYFISCENCSVGVVGNTCEDAAYEWNMRTSEWIPVSERLPEEGEDILYYFKEVGIHIGCYLGNEDGYDCFGGNSGWLCGDVTHWMPLPAPPKGES